MLILDAIRLCDTFSYGGFVLTCFEWKHMGKHTFCLQRAYIRARSNVPSHREMDCTEVLCICLFLLLQEMGGTWNQGSWLSD